MDNERSKRSYMMNIVICIVFVLGLILGYLIGIGVFDLQTSKTVYAQDMPSPEQCSIDKPVIYLYGYNNESVNVGLKFDGTLTCTYPKITNGKWTVQASKDGKLKKDNREYQYLFWEGRSNASFDFSTGFCVEGSQTAQFLEKNLIKLGLNNKEMNDFITYWLPKMQDNPYNVISFQGKNYTNMAKLTVDPAPKKIIRVFMAFYPSDTKVDIKEPKIEGILGRSSDDTTLVEWGGTQVDPETFKTTDKSSEEVLDDAIVEELASKSDIEIQVLLARAAELRRANGNDIPAVAATKGHEFTDKNGQKYTFTDEEWRFLQNTWSYTGKADTMIAQFTIAELRAYIANNMRK